VKKCTRCAVTKPISDFTPSQGRITNGGYCRECAAKYRREWAKKHPEARHRYKAAHRNKYPERIRAYKREVYHRNVERSRAQQTEWREANPEKIEARRAAYRERGRMNYIRRTYGLEPDQYFGLYDRQEGRCAICLCDLPRDRPTREQMKAGVLAPHVDHCHDTGAIRGILCGPCNQGLGLLRESVANLARAVDYLNGMYEPIVVEVMPTIIPPPGKRTHCPQGHPYDEANTIFHRDGSRRCRACVTTAGRKG